MRLDFLENLEKKPGLMKLGEYNAVKKNQDIRGAENWENSPSFVPKDVYERYHIENW